MSKSQQAYPKSRLMSPQEVCRTDNAWKVSPSGECHTPVHIGSKYGVSTSTPRTATSTPHRHQLQPIDDSSYDNRPANWNRRSQPDDSCFSTDVVPQNFQHQTHSNRYYSPLNKHSQQRNSLQDYIVPNSSKKVNKKNSSLSLNNSSTDNHSSLINNSHGSSKTGQGWDGKNSQISLNISDSESFPPMARGSSQKPEKSNNSKKKRIKPTRVGNNKSQSQTAYLQTESANCLETSEQMDNNVFIQSNSRSSINLDQERLLLREMKADLKKKNIVKNLDIDLGKKNKSLGVSCHEESSKLHESFSAVNILQDNSSCPELVSNVETLDDYVIVYSYLVLYNHVPSLMMELYFTFQLLTARGCLINPSSESAKNVTSSSQHLTSVHNCVYFACHVLLSVSSVLQLLDRATLRLLCDNKRLQLFAPSLHQQLLAVVTVAPALPSPKQPPRSPMKGVPFQADTDNRANFPNNTTFHIFRKQRDLFYEVGVKCRNNCY